MALRPSLVPTVHADESPVSFCSRVARLSLRSARDFALDMGFRFQGIVDGNQADLDMLCEVCALPGKRFPGTAMTGSGRRF